MIKLALLQKLIALCGSEEDAVKFIYKSKEDGITDLSQVINYKRRLTETPAY